MNGFFLNLKFRAGEPNCKVSAGIPDLPERISNGRRENHAAGTDFRISAYAIFQALEKLWNQRFRTVNAIGRENPEVVDIKRFKSKVNIQCGI